MTSPRSGRYRGPRGPRCGNGPSGTARRDQRRQLWLVLAEAQAAGKRKTSDVVADVLVGGGVLGSKAASLRVVAVEVDASFAGVEVNLGIQAELSYTTPTRTPRTSRSSTRHGR